jgi:GntR family transcriptional regulator, trigonelline degradation regulator
MDIRNMRILAVAAPLRQQVVDKIRSAIIAGDFHPGQRLVERDLCELLGVSRPPVREALRQLDAEGFVHTVPNRGPIVTELDFSSVRSLYEVRAVLEAQAAKLFSERASDGEMQALIEATAEIERVYRNGTTDARLAAKNRFYEIVIAGSRNEILPAMFRTINDRVNLLRRMSMSSDERLPQSLAEIKAIVDAITKRNSSKAFELSIAHVAAASDAALRSLKP